MRFGTANKLGHVGVLREQCSLVEPEGSHPNDPAGTKRPLEAALFVPGGDEGDRTLDLRIANATLSQLSYIPEIFRLPATRYTTAIQGGDEGVVRDSHCLCDSRILKRMRFRTARALWRPGVPSDQ